MSDLILSGGPAPGTIVALAPTGTTELDLRGGTAPTSVLASAGTLPGALQTGVVGVPGPAGGQGPAGAPGAAGAAGPTGPAGTSIKYATTIGDGTATTYTVTHNLNSTDLQVAVFSSEGSPPTVTAVTLATVNTASIVFSRAPLSASVRVIVLG